MTRLGAIFNKLKSEEKMSEATVTAISVAADDIFLRLDNLFERLLSGDSANGTVDDLTKICTLKDPTFIGSVSSDNARLSVNFKNYFKGADGEIHPGKWSGLMMLIESKFSDKYPEYVIKAVNNTLIITEPDVSDKIKRSKMIKLIRSVLPGRWEH